MGKSEVDVLGLWGALLLAVYLSLSAWTFYVAYSLQYNDVLLGSLVPSLVLFAIALATKRGGILRLSWAWLGLNFVASQAILPGTSYPLIIVSAAAFLLAFDLSNFFEFALPMEARSAEIDRQQYERTRSLLKRHVMSASLFVLTAGVLSLAGIMMLTPLVYTYNPVLVVGIVTSTILVLTALLTSEWRGTGQRKGSMPGS